MSVETTGPLEGLVGEYILGARMRSQSEVRDQVVGPLTEVPQGFAVLYPARACAEDPSPLAVKEVRVGAHRYLVRHKAEQARKDAHDREAIIGGLRQALRAGDKSLVGNQGYQRFSRKNCTALVTGTVTEYDPPLVPTGSATLVQLAPWSK
jgi:hypothetical protein